MPKHTTNYTNTLIEIAEDCPVNKGEVPPLKSENKSIAQLQYEMLSAHPYGYSSDEILFTIHATRNQVQQAEWKEAKEIYFSKGQACMRTSPLAKRYGWGLHHNEEGKVALCDSASEGYKDLIKNALVKKVKAMKSKRN